jgi:ABC-2 type transport system ATP-binding protein
MTHRTDATAQAAILGDMAHAAAELRHATKRFGSVTALDDVDLALVPGRVTAILGQNGAGKTTAVRLMIGLAEPTSGTARLFGLDPQSLAARQRLGVMLQISKVPETLKVREHIHLFSSYYPSPMPAAEVIEIAGLEGLEHRAFGQLSGGEKQRVLFALAICGNPDLLVLDEPTVGLDVDARRRFWQETRQLIARGRSLLLTTHYLEEADALADRVVILQHGRIIVSERPNAATTERLKSGHCR